MSRKQVLLTGGNGQLGSSLLKLKSDFIQLDIISTDLEDLDISKEQNIIDYLSSKSIDYIINSAAYTAVDKAENDESQAFIVNHNGPANLARICKKLRIPLIHISTDYVFSGEAHLPYEEDNPTSPVGVYGRSKLAGESSVLGSGVYGLVIRTSWLYSEYGNNFVKSMVRLGRSRSKIGVVFDQIGSPTYAENLAHSILTIIKGFVEGSFVVEPVEIYHYCNHGICSWYDFAQAIMEIGEINCKVLPITSEEFPLPAKRPHYSVMNTGKIRDKFGLEIPYWRESLTRCIEQITI